MLYLIIAIIVILLSLMIFFLRVVLRGAEYKKSIMRLSKLLFPDGDSQRDMVLQEFDALTDNHYSKDELLDYYLKIKGLQVVDLHAMADSTIRRFLMRPTKIRLKYTELKKFYATYLDYRQEFRIAGTGFSDK